MRKPNFTAGPWEFRAYASGCTIVSAQDRPGSTVRDTLKGVAVLVDASVRDDQSDADKASPDARLLCASPLLAEALCMALDALHEAEAILGGEYGDHYGPFCAQMQKAEQNAAAALRAAGYEVTP